MCDSRQIKQGLHEEAGGVQVEVPCGPVEDCCDDSLVAEPDCGVGAKAGSEDSG